MKSHVSEILTKVEPYILSVSIINLGAVIRNYLKIKEEVGENVKVAGVVKANAYGFGAIEISSALISAGCQSLFVATIEEGVELRENIDSHVDIYVFGGILPNTENIFYKYNLIPVLNNIHQADIWLSFAKTINEKLKAVIHVDTGMSRCGFSEDDIAKYYDAFLKSLHINFIMSHLACADILGHESNIQQLNKFKNILQKFENFHGSLSATNGIFLGDEYHFDIVRPGKSLYGFSIRDDMIGSFEPVMDIFSRIVQINNVDIGDSIGYGATFIAKRKMRTITVGIGYADGFMRKFSGYGHCFLCGQKMKIVGRISMDYMVLDATDVDESCLVSGNWVALTCSPDYTLEKWAIELDTLPHEIACRLGNRVKKIYFGL